MAFPDGKQGALISLPTGPAGPRGGALLGLVLDFVARCLAGGIFSRICSVSSSESIINPRASAGEAIGTSGCLRLEMASPESPGA
ncbi:unnamed protein product, partial [Gulo gulo]